MKDFRVVKSCEGYDIYVLMTGLMENIRNIRNEKSLTFLYRAKVRELVRIMNETGNSQIKVEHIRE